MHPFKLQGSRQSLCQSIRRFVSARHGLRRVKLCRGAELLHAHARDGQFLSGHEGQGIEAASDAHSHPIRQMYSRDMLVQHLAD